MANFSGRAAIKSGFSLIRREPAAIAAWALLHLAFGIGPQLLLQRVVGGGHPPSRPADPHAVFANLSRLAMWWPILFAVSLAYWAVAYSAIYRAVLNPDDRQYFFLRLSR